MTQTPHQVDLKHWSFFAVGAVLAFWVMLLSLKIGVFLIAGLAIFSYTRFVRRAFERICLPASCNIRQPVFRWLVGVLPVWGSSAVVALSLVLVGFGFITAVKFVAETLIDQGPQLVQEAMASLFELIASLPAAHAPD